MTRRPVIAVAGLACETSTFTPSRTDKPAFHPKYGPDAIALYRFLDAGTPLQDAADWHGALIGRALPGGMITRAAYESLADEMVEQLTAIVASTSGGIDGLWFDIHGAMVVEGLDDSEADLLRRARAVIGPNVIVSASMDLHGNVSRDLVHMLDLITCYRMAPHEDELDTKERACANLVQCLTHEQGRRPLKAWIPVPILLPGEQTSTRDEPAKHIYAAVPTIESQPGVLDAAIWVGYAWADEPRNRAAIVVTGWDADAVASGAERLARLFWAARGEFHFVAPTGTLDECLDVAVAAPAQSRPYFISDSGDNPTAGGSGDVTWGLTQLLRRPEFAEPCRGGEAIQTVIYASIPGPEAVQTAVAAGVGSTVTVTAGAAVDDVHSGPITLTGVVHAIKHGDKYAHTEVVLRVRGKVYVIVTELRKPYHKESDFTDLDLQPRQADIVLVKIGYLEPQLYDMAADWMLALTPGGVDQDLKRLGHQRIRWPMFPFDTEFEDHPPDLSARMIPLSVYELTGPDE